MDPIVWLTGGGALATLVVILITVIVVMAVYSVGIFAKKEGVVARINTHFTDKVGTRSWKP